MDKIIAAEQISNMIDHINFIPRNITNIIFAHCNRSANSLADRMTKRPILPLATKCNISWLNIVICFFFKKKKKRKTK